MSGRLSPAIGAKYRDAWEATVRATASSIITFKFHTQIWCMRCDGNFPHLHSFSRRCERNQESQLDENTTNASVVVEEYIRLFILLQQKPAI